MRRAGRRRRGVRPHGGRPARHRARLTGLAEVFLRVHPDDAAALRCHLGAGFAPVTPELAAEWNVPQPVAYVRLRHAA
ncbi:hypothetical protein ACFZAU_01575 [Streptomyces sp. NPDC008238]